MVFTAVLLALGPVVGAVVFLLVSDQAPRRPARRPLPADGPTDWRATPLSKALVVGLCATIAGAMVADTAASESFAWRDLPLLAIIFSPFIVLVFRPRLSITNDGHLTVRNLRSRQLRLTDVIEAKATNAGIDVLLRSGKTKTAWAVQKSNFAFMRGWTTRADQVSDLINERARAARAASGDTTDGQG